MAKNALSDWSATAASNTDLGGLPLSQNTTIDSLDDITRELMAQIKTGFATKSQQESAASAALFTNPANQQHHPSAAKAWARVTESAGDYTLAGAYNIASVVDNGTGNVTVNFATDFTSAAFACFVTTDSSGTSGAASSPAAGSVVVRIYDTTPTAVDDGFYLVAFGYQ